MIDLKVFENVIKRYLHTVLCRKDDRFCLVWNCTSLRYEQWDITDVTDNLDDFGCAGNRLLMWLTPAEAMLLYKQRQLNLPV